jgi:hypothetical protein
VHPIDLPADRRLRLAFAHLLVLATATACSPASERSAPPQALALLEPATRCRVIVASMTDRVQHAARLAARARMGEERYRFDPSAGPRAFHDLSEAELCLAAGGDVPLLEQVRERRTQLTDRLERDYHDQRSRLQQALDAERGALARDSCHVLLSLLTGRDGPYVDWLREISRSAP